MYLYKRVPTLTFSCRGRKQGNKIRISRAAGAARPPLDLHSYVTKLDCNKILGTSEKADGHLRAIQTCSPYALQVS